MGHYGVYELSGGRAVPKETVPPAEAELHREISRLQSALAAEKKRRGEAEEKLREYRAAAENARLREPWYADGRIVCISGKEDCAEIGLEGRAEKICQWHNSEVSSLESALAAETKRREEAEEANHIVRLQLQASEQRNRGIMETAANGAQFSTTSLVITCQQPGDKNCPLSADNARLRKALEFYARLENWARTGPQWDQEMSPAEKDEGTIAANTLAQKPGGEGCTCQSCGRKYRVDLLIPNELWERIKPAGKPEGAGLLCGRCIMSRIEALGGFGALHASAEIA